LDFTAGFYETDAGKSNRECLHSQGASHIFRNSEFIPPFGAAGQSGGMNSAFRINPQQPFGKI
jgi:hypothetical protein